MKVVFKILALILLGLTITGCELLDPREWQRLKREDDMTGREYDRYTRKTTNSRPHCLVDENGHKMGNYTLEYRINLLRELFIVQKEIQKERPSIQLITSQELAAIQLIWYRDGNFSTTVNSLYNEVYGYDLPNDDIQLQERVLLEKFCKNNSHYQLIQELLALQKNKNLLIKKVGLQTDLEERLEKFVKA